MGLSQAVDAALAYLQLFNEDAHARHVKLDEARPFVGPYQAEEDRSWWQNKINHLLNRLLWRQHIYNQKMFSGLHDCFLSVEPGSNLADKPLLQIIVPNDVTENNTGGSARMWGMAEALSRYYRVQLLSISRGWREPVRRKIFAGVDLLVFPLSREIEQEFQRKQSVYGDASSSLVMGDPSIPFPLFDNYIRRTAGDAALVIMVGPYLFDRFRSHSPSVRLVFDMHDIYSDYLGRVAGSCKDAALPVLKEMESRIINDCRLLTPVCQADADEIVRCFPVCGPKIMVIPNGIAMAHVFKSIPSESLQLARSLGINQPIILFMGSVLGANIQAIAYVIEQLSPAYPDVCWVVMGVNKGEFFALHRPCTLPRNVVFAGRVPATEKEALMALASIAIAPMAHGTGSSLKIPDYIAHGKILISTPVGMRGFEQLVDKVDIVDLNQFTGQVGVRLKELVSTSAQIDRRADAAWQTVKAQFDWPVIAASLHTRLQTINNQ